MVEWRARGRSQQQRRPIHCRACTTTTATTTAVGVIAYAATVIGNEMRVQLRRGALSDIAQQLNARRCHHALRAAGSRCRKRRRDGDAVVAAAVIVVRDRDGGQTGIGRRLRVPRGEGAALRSGGGGRRDANGHRLLHIHLQVLGMLLQF